MMAATWRTISLLALSMAALALLPAKSEAVCPVPAGGQVCIDQPVVNHPSFNYTGTTFAAGSYVTVFADGCEQTGGSGATWKRYVNPDPPGGNSEYHGRVAILSSTGGAAALPNSRFLDVNGHQYRVTTNSFLQVGFEDDGYPADGGSYTDNNYSNHDDGNNNQCQWANNGVLGHYYGPWGYGGPAYILLTVSPNRPPNVSATGPSGVVSGVTTLSASAGDPDGDGYTLSYLIDGQSVATTAATSVAWNSRTAADGNHGLLVRATDIYSGSATSGQLNFTVDNTPPTVAINSGPDGQTFGPHSTQKWTFSAFDATSGVKRLECRIDSAAFGPCTDAGSFSVSNLGGGSHTFSVQAIDNAGWASPVAGRAFVIDATPPETTITGGPVDGASTTDTTATYTFASSKPGSTFECSLSASAASPPAARTFVAASGFGPCTTPSSFTAGSLTPGTYTFQVRATDPYGNVDPTPATRTLTVTAPQAPPAVVGSPGQTGPTTSATTPAATLKPMGVTVSYTFRASRRSTRFTSLKVTGIPPGSKVNLTCAGRGCARGLTRRGYTRSHASGRLSLTSLVKKPLRTGDRLTVTVTHPGYVGTVKTLRVRASKAPLVTARCLLPGARRPRAC